VTEYGIGIVGATGVVGRELIALIEERSFPCRSIRLFASGRSAGRSIDVPGGPVEVENLEGADLGGLDLAFFSAGAERSRRFAPQFADQGIRVIDNSSAFRRDPDIPLIVPEINGRLLRNHAGRIIANPNCSTIAALMPLAALERAFGLEQVLVSTYQAVSGAGASALAELEAQTRAAAEGREPESHALPRRIVHNLIPWIGEVDDSGFCEEERKIAFESRKILDRPDLKISATTVRVPVKRCHSISIWCRLARRVTLEEVRGHLDGAPGVALAEAPPGPAECEGRDPVTVGRVRRDPDDDRAFWLWAVSDQLRKGAALNAIQIAEWFHEAK
jgi:aspartate-semialdehyde dehydrogenase